MTRIDKLDSVQIQLCRVICIFFMMSAHITPGPLEPSAVMTGDFQLVGKVWIEWLGRSSVATLSLISGFLLWTTSRHTPVATMAVSKFRSLIVPMVFWNAVFIIMLVEKGGPAGAGFSVSSNSSFMHWVNGLFGLTGPTANLSLYFLRDLFVSLIAVRLCSDLIARYPVPAVLLTLVAAVFGLLEPVIFRPSILFFAVLGMIFASRDLTLQRLSSLRIIVPVILALAVPYGILAWWIGDIPVMPNGDHFLEALFLIRRAILICVSLCVTAIIARAAWSSHIAKHARHIFESYLLHRIIISVAWIGWAALAGPATDNSYVLFFVLAPFLAIAGGELFGRLADSFPSFLQIIVRGKICPPRRYHANVSP